MRIGIDGFAVDAWAGGDGARQTLDALFKVAEAKDYPFELTVCLDPTCGGSDRGHRQGTAGQAREEPQTGAPRRQAADLRLPVRLGRLRPAGDSMLPDRSDELRLQPVGWHMLGQSLGDAARQVGQPIYYHYCHGCVLLWCGRQARAEGLADPGRRNHLARYADAIGGFSHLGQEQAEIGKAARPPARSGPCRWACTRRRTFPYECYVPKGTDWMHWGQDALDQDATLLQIITWNDYGENTYIAPAWNTRYTLYDLTGYEIKLWKTRQGSPTGSRPHLPHLPEIPAGRRRYSPSMQVFRALRAASSRC